ncbi:MAG: hypothetical protein O7C59_09300, partial [Rickettsia endosymbiont of Ixodes persulcatus]|nr:hypothetical protein [Rickettsia endosymbiont of Ixodes persulcatus]
MLNEMYIDNKQATYQVWEKNIYQPIGLNDLELLGTFFDAHQRILFLCAAGGYLYHLSYNVIENKLSNSLKRSAKLPETIYNAKVYELNENIVKWYLLGETNIYQLEVERSTFVGKLIPYPKRYYPRDITIENKLHEGGSLVVFDRLPWVIGGKDFKNGINTSRRLFTGGCYFTNPGYTQCPGRVEHNFLSHERTSPIVHMYDDKFICIGGNSSSQPENIMEFINIRPYYPIPRHGQAREDDATRVFTTLRSIVAYSNKNCGLQTTSPSPASCL